MHCLFKHLTHFCIFLNIYIYMLTGAFALQTMAFDLVGIFSQRQNDEASFAKYSEGWI